MLLLSVLNRSSPELSGQQINQSDSYNPNNSNPNNNNNSSDRRILDDENHPMRRVLKRGYMSNATTVRTLSTYMSHSRTYYHRHYGLARAAHPLSRARV